MYRALASGDADVITAFSSDGRIAADKLTVLHDHHAGRGARQREPARGLGRCAALAGAMIQHKPLWTFEPEVDMQANRAACDAVIARAAADWSRAALLDRLEQRGALERRTAPQDRRARQLWLTDAGAQLLAGAVPAMLAAQRQILAPLTERQQGEFMRLLRTVVDENNALSRAPSDTVK